MTSNPIQLEGGPVNRAPIAAHWSRSRSSAYARIKATVLALAGRYNAGSMREAVRGHSALIELTNTHDRLTPACIVISSDADGRILWNTPLGELWTPAEASAKYVAGIVAEQMVAAYSSSRRPDFRGEVVLDCGANVGIFTRNAVSRGAKLVVAVEPSSENALCFRRNLAAAIQSGKVILVEKALAECESELWLDTSNHRNPGSWVVSSSVGEEGQRVAVTTVDKIVQELGLQRVDRLKIDVEGFELKALMGARATLKRFEPKFAVAVEHNNQEVAQVISEISQTVGDRYRSHCSFYRCDDQRRLHPQMVYFVPRKRHSN